MSRNIYRAVEPDWEKVVETARRDAWSIINMIAEWEEMNVSASKIGLTAGQLFERAVSNLSELLNGVN